MTNAQSYLAQFAVNSGAPKADFDLLASEALFGWREIRSRLNDGQECLEIGAGPGLLAALAAECRSIEVDALEPTAEGFSFSSPVLDRVVADPPSGLNVIRSDIESFETEKQYDFIWSLNVFEHLSDWREALIKTRSLLKANGCAIILCPNYDVLYEPHFRLPIFGSKTRTQRLFAKRIAAYEDKHGCHGLWNSINMIGVRDIRRLARDKGIDISFDRTLIVRMFERLDHDEQLASRQRWLRPITRFFGALQIHRVWSALPVDTHPYIAIIVTAKDGSS
ncbi:MAG: class I SAM-dependent methyltransferase [Maricaulis sp.]|nr:class I SAM-dependent methyltransferase [Maricaulis sp.]